MPGPSRFVIAALLFAALVPSRALAQDGQGNTPGDGPGYEPDQRGVVEQAPEAPSMSRDDGESDVDLVAGSASAEGTFESGRHRLQLVIDLGAALTALDSAGQSNLVRPSQEGSVGGAIGFSAGLRWGLLAFGPRIAMIIDPSFVLANLGVGLQIAFLPGELAPFVSASLGATIVSNLNDPLPAQSPAIFGLGAELGGGVRWQPDGRFILGGELAAGWHHLWRDAAACEGACSDGEFDVRTRGESDALTLRLSVFAGYTF